MRVEKKQDKRNLFKSLCDTMAFNFMRFGKWFKKNLREISTFVLAATPILALIFGDGLWSDGHSLYFGPASGFIIFLDFASVFGIAVSYEISKPLSLPIPPKEFTTVNGDVVDVKKEDLEDMVIYMAQLEDWLYDNGYTR